MQLEPVAVRPSRACALLTGAGAATCIALGVLVAGTVTSPAPYREVHTRRIAEAREAAQRYAFEGFPRWALANPAYACPQKLAELDRFAGRANTLDPWGLPFIVRCTGTRFLVLSAGPDGLYNTGDDIRERT